jgi:hypothetical protein
MIHMLLKWHHIDKCIKNYKKVDFWTSIFGSFELIYTQAKVTPFNFIHPKKDILLSFPQGFHTPKLKL